MCPSVLTLMKPTVMMFNNEYFFVTFCVSSSTFLHTRCNVSEFVRNYISIQSPVDLWELPKAEVSSNETVINWIKMFLVGVGRNSSSWSKIWKIGQARVNKQHGHLASVNWEHTCSGKSADKLSKWAGESYWDPWNLRENINWMFFLHNPKSSSDLFGV